MNEPFSAEQDVAEEGLPKVPAGDEGRRSYSSVVGRALPDVDSLPDPIHAGTDTKIIVPQDAYEERLQGFRFALIGRANFKFISMDDIRKEARETWNLKGGVKMAPMGKGYILFKFEKESDMTALWRRSLTRVAGHVLRFQRWKPDFDVHAKNINTKLVWIRFPDLPLEYWHEKILLTMAKAAGRPVALDRCTRAASMGSFARVQVEIEMGASRPEEIQVERRQPGTGEIFWFKQIISYEDGMLRCGYCKRMGHNVQSCRHRKAPNREVQHREGHIDGETFGEEEGGRQDEGPWQGGDAAEMVSNAGRSSAQPMHGSLSFSRAAILRQSTPNSIYGNLEIILPLEDNSEKEGNLPSGNGIIPNQLFEGCSKEYSVEDNNSEASSPHGQCNPPSSKVDQQLIDRPMVDNPLGGTEYGSDPADSASSLSEHDSHPFREERNQKGAEIEAPNTGRAPVPRTLRPRKNRAVNIGRRGGCRKSHAGRGGRDHEWEGPEHVVSDLSPSHIVGGRVIVQHQEVTAIDSFLRDVEDNSNRPAHEGGMLGQTSMSGHLDATNK